MSKYINRGTCISMGDNNKVSVRRNSKGVVVNNISGSSICISGGKVYVDGKEYTGDNGELENKEVVSLIVNITGDLKGDIDADCDLQVNVTGDVKCEDIYAGMNATVVGNVEGAVRSGMNVTIKGNQKGKCSAGMTVNIGTKVYE